MQSMPYEDFGLQSMPYRYLQRRLFGCTLEWYVVLIGHCSVLLLGRTRPTTATHSRGDAETRQDPRLECNPQNKESKYQKNFHAADSGFLCHC